MPRPETIGVVVQIDSLESADAALHELGWLLHEKSKIDAAAKQAIEDLKEKYAGKQALEIQPEPVDGKLPPVHSTTFGERIELLSKSLEEWTAENIKGHLKDKKTVRLKHGELGLRQQPRVVVEDEDPESGEDYTPEQILNWIRESDLTNAQKKALTETKVSLHLKGAKDAYEGGKITKEGLAAVGLVVREACDAPVVKPAKITVTAEA